MSELTENQLNAKFAQKVAKVVAAITGIEKNGRNAHFNYDFAADPDVLRAVRSAILEAGLVILPSINESARNGSNTTIRGTFEMIDTETGHLRSYCWAGEADDKQDKGTSKAATSFVKYFLLKAFLIPTGDDPDAQGPVEATKPAKTEPETKKQTAADVREVSAARYLKETIKLTPDECRQYVKDCKDKKIDWVDVCLEAFGSKITTFDGLIDRTFGIPQGV